MSVETRTTFRRRTYLVNLALQGKWVLAVVGAALITGVLLVIEYYLYFGRNASGGAWSRDLFFLFLGAHRMMALQLAVFVAALAGLTVYFSHRVAGPLVNLRRCMERLAAGDVDVRARFRRKDELHELAEAFNRLAEALSAREGDRRRELDALLSDAAFPDALRPRLRRLLPRIPENKV